MGLHKTPTVVAALLLHKYWLILWFPRFFAGNEILWLCQNFKGPSIKLSLTTQYTPTHITWI